MLVLFKTKNFKQAQKGVYQKNALFQSNFEIFTNGLIQRLFETNTLIFLSWHPYGFFLKLLGPTILVSCSNF